VVRQGNVVSHTKLTYTVRISVMLNKKKQAANVTIREKGAIPPFDEKRNGNNDNV
jgi:hypothetical protein